MLTFTRKLLAVLERIAMSIETATADLTKLTDVGDGMAHLLGDLSQAVRDLKSAGTDPATAAKIEALDATIQAKTAEWSAAVVANTPAAP